MAKKNDLKTKISNADVTDFINKVDSPASKEECFTLIKMMSKHLKAEPKMWGPSIVGFGSYHYKYASGREGDWFVCGFSPRKHGLSVYLSCDLSKPSDLLDKLGKYKMGKSCLNIKTLSDIDLRVLEKLIVNTKQQLKNNDKS